MDVNQESPYLMGYHLNALVAFCNGKSKPEDEDYKLLSAMCEKHVRFSGGKYNLLLIGECRNIKRDGEIDVIDIISNLEKSAQKLWVKIQSEISEIELELKVENIKIDAKSKDIVTFSIELASND